MEYYRPPPDPPAEDEQEQYQQYGYPPRPSEDPGNLDEVHAEQQYDAHFDGDEDDDLPNFDDMESREEFQEQYSSVGQQEYSSSIPSLTTTNRNLVTVYKKAPGAPKRFKSSYVLFFTDFLEKKKQELGPDGLPLKFDISVVSKECSQAWKALPSDKKKYWDDLSEIEKQGYMEQKAAYQGPWRVATNKMKSRKKEGAPKRSPSAFFLFANDRRPFVKEEHPDMPPSTVVKACSELWNSLPPSEKAPYLEAEQKLRAQYHIDAEQWKKGNGKANQKGKHDIRGLAALENSDRLVEEQERRMSNYPHLHLSDHLPSVVEPGCVAPTGATGRTSSIKKRTVERDPNAPKRSPPAFFLFVNHCRPAIRNEYPELKQTELIKLLGQKWAAMSEEEKILFRNQEEVLRQQYYVDMEQYRKQAIP